MKIPNLKKNDRRDFFNNLGKYAPELVTAPQRKKKPMQIWRMLGGKRVPMVVYR